MKKVKFKIIKPSYKSGYFAGYVGEVDESLIEGIERLNEIEILSEAPAKVEEEKKEVKAPVKKRATKKQ